MTDWFRMKCPNNHIFPNLFHPIMDAKSRIICDICKQDYSINHLKKLTSNDYQVSAIIIAALNKAQQESKEKNI